MSFDRYKDFNCVVETASPCNSFDRKIRSRSFIVSIGNAFLSSSFFYGNDNNIYCYICVRKTKESPLPLVVLESTFRCGVKHVLTFPLLFFTIAIATFRPPFLSFYIIFFFFFIINVRCTDVESKHRV